MIRRVELRDLPVSFAASLTVKKVGVVKEGDYRFVLPHAVRKLSRDKIEVRPYVGGLTQSFERKAA